MAAPLPQLRKELSAPGLLETTRSVFNTIQDIRKHNDIGFSLPDVLMSATAMFSLKYPSLLQFDNNARDDETLQYNLRTLYKVDKAPCDTYMREVIDSVNPEDIKPVFRAIHQSLQRGKALEQYEYLNGYHLISVDGTGHFASTQINCGECCVKESKNGSKSYYHQLLGAVMVHPDRKTVLPFAPEAITRQDGSTKNDCERNASKRLLIRLREEFPYLKMIVIEDALASNGPHIQLLKDLDMRFILGVKEGDHEALFESVQEKMSAGETQEFEKTDKNGTLHGFRFINNLPLNKANKKLLVNFLEYWSIDKKGNSLLFSWVTDIELHVDNVEAIMKGGRSRWKIENETFNTLKNQGYNLEHNYGHGKQHLTTNFGILTMLAFLIDQTQELCCRVFQGALKRCRNVRIVLWDKLRSAFTTLRIPDWNSLWEAITSRDWRTLASHTLDTT